MVSKFVLVLCIFAIVNSVMVSATREICSHDPNYNLECDPGWIRDFDAQPLNTHIFCICCRKESEGEKSKGEKSEGGISEGKKSIGEISKGITDVRQ